MKIHSFTKQFFMITSVSALSLTFAPFASAEESDPYLMQPDAVYEMDLDGDGQMEQISYSTWMNEPENAGCQAVFEFYVNSDLLWSVTEETQSYYWELNQFALDDGQQYFLASCITDNDYNLQTLLFTADSASITMIDDLTLLTRESEEHPDALLSSWSRANSVLDASDNTFTLQWCDAFMSTGNNVVPVTYTISEGQVILKEGSCLLDEEQTWTAWIDFDVQVSPEDATHAFHVSPEETVRITELIRYNEHNYFKCINENGEEGWFADPESYVSSQSTDGTYLMGYFYETFFAG